MVKDIYGWELTDNYEKVLVKQFNRSTTEDMMTYIKPPLKCNPDRFIIHVGTNDLKPLREMLQMLQITVKLI